MRHKTGVNRKKPDCWAVNLWTYLSLYLRSTQLVFERQQNIHKPAAGYQNDGFAHCNRVFQDGGNRSTYWSLSSLGRWKHQKAVLAIPGRYSLSRTSLLPTGCSWFSTKENYQNSTDGLPGPRLRFFSQRLCPGHQRSQEMNPHQSNWGNNESRDGSSGEEWGGGGWLISLTSP